MDALATRATCSRGRTAPMRTRRRVVLTSMRFFPGKTHIHRAKAPQKAPFHRLIPLRPFGTVWLDTGQASTRRSGRVCPQVRARMETRRYPRDGPRSDSCTAAIPRLVRSPSLAPQRCYLAYSNAGAAFSASFVAPAKTNLLLTILIWETGTATSCLSMPRKPPAPTMA